MLNIAILYVILSSIFLSIYFVKRKNQKEGEDLTKSRLFNWTLFIVLYSFPIMVVLYIGTLITMFCLSIY